MASQLRQGLLIRTLVEVLREQPQPMPAGSAVEEVAARLELTDRELSHNVSGVRRFDTFLRFGTSRLVAAGWLEKGPDGWLLTDAGREAYDRYPGTQLWREAERRYRQAGRGRQPVDQRWSDPRWQQVREAVAAVPEGSWTAYQDLSDLAGLPARTIGAFLADTDLPGAHRVLTVDGAISPDFRWSDPHRTDDPRELLTEEGVTFDAHGRAPAAQRITGEELREFTDTAPAGARGWLVRGSAVAGVNVVGQWLEEGFVSLAAAHLRQLEPGIDVAELRAAVAADYAHLTYNQRQTKAAELQAFWNRMAIGDLVVTASDGIAYLGRIDGYAEYSDVGDTRTTIRRPVSWQLPGVDFADLSGALQAKLRSAATVVDLTEVVDELETLLPQSHAEVVAAPLVREATLPELPAETVARLLVGAEWLDDFVHLLRTRRQVILHGPPGTGKTYLALEVAQAVTDPANVTLVQFHPAYSYEDFFEGYRPVPGDGGTGVRFALTPGPFRKLVDRARENPGTPYVLIIDEINRANLAKVFGELYFLLEYRERAIDLMYSSGEEEQQFSLPPNVYLIGTMNTADRSIALVDAAMRRRFAFLSLHPDDPHLRGVLRAWLDREGLPDAAARLLDALNARIGDPDFKVGPSYLMDKAEVGSERGLERIWRTAILPLLAELHYGDPGIDIDGQYGLPALRAATGLDQAPAPTSAPAPPAGGD